MLGFAATTANSVHTAYTNKICTLHLLKYHRTTYTSQKALILFRISMAFSRNNVSLVKQCNKQALVSVSGKQDLSLLANGLQDLWYTIVSTGGTTTVLEKAGVSVTKVEQVTSFPKMLDIRVKTLHPSIHGGILTTNHKDVLVVVDAADYPALLEFLKGNQANTHFRRKLAWKAFERFSSFRVAMGPDNKFPPSLTKILSNQRSLRYGENPHQKAAFYVDKSLSEVNTGGIATARSSITGRLEMSYNYLDADAAWNCVTEFPKPTSSRDDILEAYRLAVKGDPVSAFGGIVAFNVEVDE
ncbi:hypothetical protein MKX01_041276, partial [Papaver californicum]